MSRRFAGASRVVDSESDGEDSSSSQLVDPAPRRRRVVPRIVDDADALDADAQAVGHIEMSESEEAPTVTAPVAVRRRGRPLGATRAKTLARQSLELEAGRAEETMVAAVDPCSRARAGRAAKRSAKLELRVATAAEESMQQIMLLPPQSLACLEGQSYMAPLVRAAQALVTLGPTRALSLLDKHPACTAICIHMLVEKSHVSSLSLESERLGVDRKNLRQEKHRIASVQLMMQRSQQMATRDRCCLSRRQAAENGVIVTFLLKLKKRAYDETPTKCRISVDDDEAAGTIDELECEAAIAKVLQVEMSYHWLLKIERPGIRDPEYMVVTGRYTNGLGVIDANSAENIVFVLKRIDPELVSGAADNVVDAFNHETHVCCTDDFGANDRAERFTEKELETHYTLIDPSEGQHRSSVIVLKCDIHKGQTCVQKTSDLDKSIFTGVVNLKLSMQMGGSASSFKKCLVIVFKKRLQVYRGAVLDPAAMAKRTAWMDLFIPTDRSANTKYLRYLMDKVLNGNPEADAEVEVPYIDDGTYPNPEVDVVRAFRTHLAPLLVKGFKLLLRTRWLNTLPSLRWVGRLMAFGDLLRSAYYLWVRGAKNTLAIKDKELDAIVEGNLHRSICDEPDVLNPLAIVAIGEAARAKAENRSAADEAHRKWREERKRFVTKSLGFVCNPDSFPRLTILTKSLESVSTLQADTLRIGSRRWREKQRAPRPNPTCIITYKQDLQFHNSIFSNGMA